MRSAAKHAIKHALIRPNSRSAAARQPVVDSKDDGFDAFGERCATHGDTEQVSEPPLDFSAPDFSAPDFCAALRPSETRRSPISVAAVTVAIAAATMRVRRCRCVPRRICSRARSRDSSTGRAEDETGVGDDRVTDDGDEENGVDGVVVEADHATPVG